MTQYGLDETLGQNHPRFLCCRREKGGEGREREEEREGDRLFSLQPMYLINVLPSSILSRLLTGSIDLGLYVRVGEGEGEEEEEEEAGGRGGAGEGA